MAFFVFSYDAAQVVAERDDRFGQLDLGMTNEMVSMSSVTARYSSSSKLLTFQRVLRTFAEKWGMLRETFEAEWPQVHAMYEMYEKYESPRKKSQLQEELPLGGKGVSLFVKDYATLPSLAVFVDTHSEVMTRFAVVYDRTGRNFADPKFGILEYKAGKVSPSVTDDNELRLLDTKEDRGIFPIPSVTLDQIQTRFTASELQHALTERPFNTSAFKVFYKGIPRRRHQEIQIQSEKLGETVTLLQAHVNITESILKMFGVPTSGSVMVADPSPLRADERWSEKHLAIWIHGGQFYPARVKWTKKRQEWNVEGEYLSPTGSVEIKCPDCMAFTPDLKQVYFDPDPQELAKAFEAMLEQTVEGRKKQDFFKTAVDAAKKTNMPMESIQRAFYDQKVKTLTFDTETLYVGYHPLQRFQAYINNRIFEHDFEGEDSATRTNAKHFVYLRDVIGEDVSPRQGLTFLLSEQRFAMGWALDGVEAGTGHNCLINSLYEPVFIAGEIYFERESPGWIAEFNFESGSFTRQIAPKYKRGMENFETQWKGLIIELIKAAWSDDPKLGPVRPVYKKDKILLPYKRAPVQKTKNAFCNATAYGTGLADLYGEWMQECICKEVKKNVWKNWCDKTKECQADDLCEP